MSDHVQVPDIPLAEILEVLPNLSDHEAPAFLAARGYSPTRIVQALKDRSFAGLAADPEHSLELAVAAMRVAAFCGGATQALAARGMAQALHANNRYIEALMYYDTAYAGFSSVHERLEAARTLLGKVDALMYLGRYTEATETALDARAAFVELDDRRRVARMDVNLGNIQHRLDRPREALTRYLEARATLALYGDAMDVAHVDHNLGNVLASLNRFEEALAAYGAAIAAYEAHGESAEAARTAYNRAYLYFLHGHFGQALAELGSARDAFASLDDRRHLALCDLDEAEILLVLNRPEEAASLAHAARRTFAMLEMRYEASKACVFEAITCLDQANLAAAAAHLAEAGTGFEREGNQLWQATIQMLLADLAVRLGAPEAALSHCDTAQELLASLQPTSKLGYIRVLRARVWQIMGRLDAARAEAEAAQASAEALGDRMLSYTSCHLLGRLQEMTGDIQAAAASYRMAMTCVDWLRGGLSRDDLRISFARDKVALFEDAVRNALQRGQMGEAFEHLERAKARALVDSLASAPPIALRAGEEDTQLAARVDQLRDALAGLYNRLHDDGETRQRFADGHRTLLSRMRACERDLTAALARLRLRRGDYASLGSATIAGLDQIQSRLGMDDALLEYYVLDDHVLAFLVTNASVQVFGPLATHTEIEELLAQWQFHLAHFRHGPGFALRHARRLRATAYALLKALHARLIAPLGTVLDGRALLIVPHGVLHHVPFQALYNGQTFLIEQHDLSYAPSATSLVLQRLQPPRTDASLIVGLPTPALPHIAEEVEAVAACQRQPLVLLEGAATRQRFMAEAERSRIVHLATHAIFRADNPLFSAIRLHDDWLTVSDIYDLDLAADLVVLSACETGTSAVLHGDELIGLTRGFLYAGAQALVTSLWAASDVATARLMATFHQEIAAGVSARRALRIAQCAALARNPHPYYWAPFILTGRVA
jgi:CHAT domain-containing protein